MVDSQCLDVPSVGPSQNFDYAKKEGAVSLGKTMHLLHVLQGFAHSLQSMFYTERDLA
jgi:hypothetical protein